MSDHAELLRQFCDVTGAPEDRSRFFLESTNWQLELALSQFFENGGNVTAAEPSVPAPVTLSSDDSMSPPPARQKKERTNDNQRFATLRSLEHTSSSDEEEGQAFYAGGSERSGQQIIGPNRSSDFVAAMFRSARERGAVVAEDDDPRGRQVGAFSGTGYRLGQTADDHTVVAPTQTSAEGPRSVRLQLYREGFTVDGGPLRLYKDPNNAAFLGCIRRGEVPPELSSTGEVRVSLEDRRHEAAPGETASAPFSGKGHMLGSPTPPTVGATVAVTSDVSDREANERTARANLRLDEAAAVTSIQIRLADGSRLVERFNHTHSVQNIRDYITAARPEYQLRNFVLMTTFPSAELKDPLATVADAALLNSVIVQRLV